MPERIEIFEKLPDGVTLHDADDGSIIQANDQFCDLLGYSRNELRELDFDDLHPNEPPYSTERAQEYIQKAATEGPQTFEWVDVTSDGERLPVEVNLRYTTIDGNNRIIAVVRDISDRKRRERELERTNQRLEEFASVVSHDIRNPLNVIEGHVELAREECESEHLAAIAHAADRMHELIDDLLTLAREGHEVVEMDPINLESIAAGGWQNVQTDNAALNITTDRYVLANRSQFQQLLENLFRNAVEHAGPEVTISVGELESGNGFYVADDGPGIALDKREKVFEPRYTQADDGTGFGLSIVRQIAEGHGWGMTLVDSVEGGARFEFHDVQMD